MADLMNSCLFFVAAVALFCAGVCLRTFCDTVAVGFKEEPPAGSSSSGSSSFSRLGLGLRLELRLELKGFVGRSAAAVEGVGSLFIARKDSLVRRSRLDV